MTHAESDREHDPEVGRADDFTDSGGHGSVTVAEGQTRSRIGASGKRIPGWMSLLAPLPTAATILVVEGLRLFGGYPPVPVTLLSATVVFSGAIGGTRGAMISAILVLAYAAISVFIAGIESAFLQPPLYSMVGLGVIILMSLWLGWLQDRNGIFFTAIRDEIDRRYRSLIRDAPEAICVLDFDQGRMIDGNLRALTLFEMDFETFTQINVAELSPAKQPDGRRSDRAAAAYVKRALRSGPVTFEWWHKSASGRVFPCEVSLSRLPDERRAVVRGSVREITERKRAEQQREGEHEVLESIAAGEGLDKSLDTLARVVERILPESVCTVVLLQTDGVHVTQCAGPSVSQAYADAIEGAAIGPKAGSCGTAMYLDREVITPDIREDPKWDEWRPAAESEGLRACWSQPIHGSDGQVLGSFAVYFREPRRPMDVELAVVSRMRNLAGIAIEHFRSAEALRHREALYRATFEHAAVGIAHVSPDGRYMRANPKFCELLGYSESELQRLSVRDVTHPDDVDRDQTGVDLMLEGREDSYHVEKRYSRKDGSTVWVNLSSGVVRNADGEVERFVVVVEDISDARRLSEELNYQARHDSLTGLINRDEFDRRLRDYLREVMQGREIGALCYLDLDQFKLVNDTVGHVAGDEVLRQLGPELQQQIRATDILARLGGDEFGVLLRGCATEDAVDVANKLRQAVEKHPFVWGDKTFKLGVSVGVVPLVGDSLPSATEVLQAADTVCYVAKDSGRNRAVVWSEDDASLYRRHGEMQWVPRLNRALDKDLFTLVAQPILALGRQARFSGWYEVLVRLNDEGKVVSPGAFLPAAERYGLAPRIDQLIVTRTLEWLRAREEDANRLSVSINLSGLSFEDEDFREFLTNTLEQSLDIAPQLCFEITETAAISNLTEAASLMESIRGLGGRIALDDFGSGLSSFAYLKALPVDYLKIDGAFVRDIARDPIDRAIVQSIREVGQVMGKEIIAEFVETEAIVEVLRELQVDYAQGFWIGHPVPLDEIKQ